MVPLELASSGFPEEQLAKVSPAAFVGWIQHEGNAGATSLESMMTGPLRAASVARDEDPLMGLAQGRRVLDALVQTAVADAARQAAAAQGVATANTVATWYEPPPYCQRCAVLIGKRVKPGTQFRRHPRCDGQVSHLSERDHRAIPGVEVEDITDLSIAQRKAIADGADMNQVINAGRSIRPGRSADRGQRLTPQQIYQLAPSRAEAIKLLAAHRYVVAR